jgi:hypothetical protein
MMSEQSRTSFEPKEGKLSRMLEQIRKKLAPLMPIEMWMKMGTMMKHTGGSDGVERTDTHAA